VKIRKKWFRKLVEKNISEQFFGECDSVCSADFLQSLSYLKELLFFHYEKLFEENLDF